MTHDPSGKLLELAGLGSDLPRSFDEIFKRTLDHRGRPVKSLDLPPLRARAHTLSGDQ